MNLESKGISSRHWLAHEIRAKYLRIHVTKWGVSLCLHVEVYGCDDDKMFERYGGKKEQTTVAKSGIQIIKKSSTNHGHEKRPAKERTPIDKVKKMRKENEMDTNGNWLLDIWLFFNNNILIIQEHEIFDWQRILQFFSGKSKDCKYSISYIYISLTNLNCC